MMVTTLASGWMCLRTDLSSSCSGSCSEGGSQTPCTSRVCHISHLALTLVSCLVEDLELIWTAAVIIIT